MDESTGVSISQMVEDLTDVSKWHSLGTHLGLTASQLDVIEQEIPAGVDAVQRRKERVLDTWMKGKSGDPSWRDIVSALMKMGEHKIAEEMRRKYNGSVPVKSAMREAFQTENQQQIREKFYKFRTLVCRKLQAMQINMKEFITFMEGLFQCADYIPPSKEISDIFESMTRHRLWDFLNFAPLRAIISKFGKDNEDIKKSLQDYQCALAGYHASTSLVKHIANKRSFPEEAFDDTDPAVVIARRDPRYFRKLSIKTNAKFTEESVLYLIELWDRVSGYLCPPSLIYLLDEIHDGSLSLTVLIPPIAMPAIILKIDDPATAKLFSKLGIIRVEIDDLCLYEEQELSVETLETASEQKQEEDSTLNQVPGTLAQIQKEASQDVTKEATEQTQNSSKLTQHDKEGDRWSEALQETVNIERKIWKRVEEENGILRSANAYMEVKIGQLRENITGLECQLRQIQEETQQLREQLQQLTVKQEFKQTTEQQEISKDSYSSFEQNPNSLKQEASQAVAKEPTEQKQVPLYVVGPAGEPMLAGEIKNGAEVESDLKSRKYIINKPVPHNYKAVGCGLQFGETNQIAHFQVHLTDANGEPCVERQEEVRAELKSLVSGSITQAKVSHQTRSVGSYKVSYQPSIRGRHDLSISVNGVAIAGNPFRVFVRQPPLLMGGPVRVIGGLDRPWRASLSCSGQLIVSEHCRISVLNNRQSEWSRINSVEQQNSTVKLNPRGVAIDDSGTIYVCDFYTDQLFKVSSSGEVLKAVGGRGFDPGKFYYPDGITLKDSRLYVCDRLNHKIQIFSCDLNFISSFGGHGSGKGKFSHPRDIALDQEGNMYVVESGNHRVQVFSPSGTFLRKFGKHGTGSGELSGPRGIYVEHNNVYIADFDNRRISIFSAVGEFITSFGTQGYWQGEFRKPRGITMDCDGFLYVCDTGNRHILVF